MWTFSRMLLRVVVVMFRVPVMSMVALRLSRRAAMPVAWRALSRVAPMAASPSLRIMALAVLRRVSAPMSRRWRAAMVAVWVWPSLVSSRLVRVWAWRAMWSP